MANAGLSLIFHVGGESKILAGGQSDLFSLSSGFVSGFVSK